MTSAISMNDTPLEHHAVDIIAAVMALLIVVALITAFLRSFSGWYEGWLRWLQVWHLGALPTILMLIFILLDVALVGFIAFVMRQYRELVNPKTQKFAVAEPINPAAEIRVSWRSIELLVQSQNPSDWNMAILRADALLDDTLREAGYEGATMADRLKVVDPIHLPSRDRVWSSHRLRNAIAHNPTDQHTRETILGAIASYRQAFRDLGFTTEMSEDTPLPGDAPDQLQ